MESHRLALLPHMFMVLFYIGSIVSPASAEWIRSGVNTSMVSIQSPVHYSYRVDGKEVSAMAFASISVNDQILPFQRNFTVEFDPYFSKIQIDRIIVCNRTSVSFPYDGHPCPGEEADFWPRSLNRDRQSLDVVVNLSPKFTIGETGYRLFLEYKVHDAIYKYFDHYVLRVTHPGAGDSEIRREVILKSETFNPKELDGDMRKDLLIRDGKSVGWSVSFTGGGNRIIRFSDEREAWINFLIYQIVLPVLLGAATATGALKGQIIIQELKRLLSAGKSKTIPVKTASMSSKQEAAPEKLFHYFLIVIVIISTLVGAFLGQHYSFLTIEAMRSMQSALIQAFAAFLAAIGVFSVYRFENIQREIQSVVRELGSLISTKSNILKGENIFRIPPRELLLRIDGFLSQKKEDAQGASNNADKSQERLSLERDLLVVALEDKARVVDLIKFPLVLNMALFIWMILYLLALEGIFQTGPLPMRTGLALLMIGLATYAVFISGRATVKLLLD